MARIEMLEREEMSEEQGAVYDEARATGSPIGGPFVAYVRLPELMRQVQNLRACLYRGPLSARERQIINLLVARHWGAKYPWAAQVKGSLAVGLQQHIIDAINIDGVPRLEDPRERAVHTLARELLATHFLSDATYADAEARLGLEGVISAVAIVGQFAMSCCTANAFAIAPPAGAPTPLAEL